MTRAAAVCLGIVLAVSVIASAHADPPTPGRGYGPRPDRSTVIETDVIATEAGVTIYVGIRSTEPGSPDSPGSSELITDAARPSCTATALNINVQSTWIHQGLREHPGTLPFGVNCGVGHSAIVWVPMGGTGTPDVVVDVLPAAPVDPLTLAQSLLGLVPLPSISVGANPGTGLVAMPSWFWVDGYGGETLYGSETLGPTTVEVEITPERYDWHFGDGATLTTRSLGRAYPDESDIQHTYEQSSGVAGGQFEVRLEIIFSARYRVTTEEDDGAGGTAVVVGAWEPLESMAQVFTHAYPVQQLQSVLTAGR